MKINLSSKGLKPTIDNSKIINSVIASATEGSTLVWPDGVFPIGSTIIQDKKLHWEGSEDTTLKASQTIALAKFIKGYKPTIERINFVGGYSINEKEKGAPMLPGILVSTVLQMRNVLVRNVWGTGIVVSANIATGTGNASFCRFDNLDIIECREHGMYFQGGDANCCSVYHTDVRDCRGIGIYDKSFLGNQFYSVMTHNNKKGSFRAEDANNRAGFFGCYAEQGQGRIQLAGCATWHGGFPSDGLEVRDWAKVYSFSTVSLK
jgi:hypothetical protein